MSLASVRRLPPGKHPGKQNGRSAGIRGSVSSSEGHWRAGARRLTAQPPLWPQNRGAYPLTMPETAGNRPAFAPAASPLLPRMWPEGRGNKKRSWRTASTL